MSTFRGGIHPQEGKEISMDKPTVTVQPKGDMVFPVSQHIGAPATPIVAVGDTVLLVSVLNNEVREGRDQVVPAAFVQK